MRAGYGRLQHLRRAMFWKRDTLVMVTGEPKLIELVERPYAAYFDDSGKKSTPLVFVGGYVSRVELWEKFQDIWIPKVTADGAQEFKRSSYSHKRRGNEFLFELEDLVRRHTICAFATGVYCEDWRQVANDYAMELYHLFPFSICARTCIGMVRAWCAKRQMSQDNMAYFVDKGSEDSGELTQLLNIDMSQEVRGVTVVPEDSKRIAAIQAADFLSWEIRNQYLVNSDPQGWHELTPGLERLMKGRYWALSNESKVPKFGVYRYANLVKLCEDAKIPLKKDVPPDVWNRPKPIRIKVPL